MNLKRTSAIFQKQIKDTFKNKTVFIQFVMFPLLAIIMKNSVKMKGMPDNFFVTMFASMYLAMAPITSMSAVIAEEKETNTLRVLMMSNVKPVEYLLGVGSYIWFSCMLGSVVFAVLGDYSNIQMLQFLGVMAIGISVSILIGAAIGTWSKNQMMATSVTVPAMMVFSFVPMLSTFNSAIEKIGTITYSQQIYGLMNQIGDLHITGQGILVIAVNLALTLGLFICAYRRSGLA